MWKPKINTDALDAEKKLDQKLTGYRRKKEMRDDPEVSDSSVWMLDGGSSK